MRPVRIIIVWKHCRSIAHNLQSLLAVMVAVRWQLYRMANSPSTLAPVNVDKYLPSRDTSTRPSVTRKKITKNKFQINKKNKKNVALKMCNIKQWMLTDLVSVNPIFSTSAVPLKFIVIEGWKQK